MLGISALQVGVNGVSSATVASLAGPAAAPAGAVGGTPSGTTRPAPPSGQVILKDKWGDDDTKEDEKASALTGRWEADHDNGSLFSVSQKHGAKDAWGKSDPQGRKVTGKGITVAVIDTGVSPLPGLDTPGKVINGPDLSFESQSVNTRHLDGYGHGTHMAGIIAGKDATVGPGDEDDKRYFVGIAPDARILNMKVATADGGTDVSQVIAAIDWVVAHRNDNGMNVRVINLSYGVYSQQPMAADPLAHAVENAWRKGIVVVAAAGNDGAASTSLTTPARDPFVIAVAASDHLGDDDPKHHVVADFTNPGTSTRRPDITAPGKSVVSLRVPGSYADRGHPEGRVVGDSNGRFFRGSGTSQATAVVSGAVALLLQARPTMTPNQVKKLLRLSAAPMTESLTPAQGAGLLDIKEALETTTPSALSAHQWHAASTGLGSLEAARGGAYVSDPDTGVELNGEVDALGSPWNAVAWAAASSSATSWSGGLWNGRRWSGDAWSGNTWSGATWTGTDWSGQSWSARRWSSDEWVARRWSGDDWHARRWSSEAWVARRWSDATWGAQSSW